MLLDRLEGVPISVTANSSDYGRLFFQAEVFRAGRLAERRKRPDATVTEPAQRVPGCCRSGRTYPRAR